MQPSLFSCTSATALQGRESQERQLLEAYQRRTTSSCGRELVLITGPSGTGKTILAKSIMERCVQAERGYFCWGKCDQMQHCNQPFAPFQSAVTQLVDNVLLDVECMGEEERLEEAINVAIQDADVSLLTSLFPVFKKVLAAQDASKSNTNFSSAQFSTHSEHPNNNNPISWGITSETPAILIFCKFLQAFCAPQHPTVFLIDDLQWLDKHSLELLTSLATTNISGFMLLGTCRGNEVDLLDPLAVVLRRVEEEHQVLITDVQLQGLCLEGVQQMVGELLELPKSFRQSAKVVALAQFLLQRTQGNPFSIQQTLRSLVSANALYRDEKTATNSWNWDLQALGGELEPTEVSDMAIRKLAEQSLVLKETLIVASFLGAAFSFRHVDVAVSDEYKAQDTVKDALSTLTQEGLVQAQKDHVGWYRWTHDRFQQSAHSLVSTSQHPKRSVQIGRRLLAQLSPSALEQHRFLVANLFLEGLDLLHHNEERISVARVLHLAGTKASISSAFGAAALFLSKGIELLPSNCWDKHYDLCIELYSGQLEMEQLIGNFETSDRLFEITIQNATCLQDRLRAYEAQLMSLSARHMDAEGVVLGFQVLRMLGEPMPRRATKVHSVVAIAKTLWWIRRTSVDSVRNLNTLPVIQRWDKRAALRILQLMTAPLIRATPAHGAVWAARGVELTLRYGYSPMAAPTFCAFGFILATVLFGLIEDAKRCTAIAHALFQQFPAPEWKCRLMVFEFIYVQPWHQPFKESLPPLLTATTVGLLSGDVDAAYIAITAYGMYGLCTAIPLQDLILVLEERYKEFANLNQKLLLVGFSLRLAQRFSGSEKGESFATDFKTYCIQELSKDEAKNKRKDNALMIVCYFCQLMHAVYTNDWSEGLWAWKRLRRLPYNKLFSVNLNVQINFLVGMAELMAYQESKALNRCAGGRSSLRKLKGWQKKMAVQSNVCNKVHLLEAERAVCRGKRQLAREKFLSSIHAAKRSGFLHEHALAHERFASALLKWGYIKESRDHIQEASTLYQEWGFHKKAKELAKALEASIDNDVLLEGWKFDHSVSETMRLSETVRSVGFNISL